MIRCTGMLYNHLSPAANWLHCVLLLPVRTLTNTTLTLTCTLHWEKPHVLYVLAHTDIPITQDVIQKAKMSVLLRDGGWHGANRCWKTRVIVPQECSGGLPYHRDSMRTKVCARWVALVEENCSSSHHVFTIFQFHQRYHPLSLPPVWPLVSMPVAQCAVCLSSPLTCLASQLA